MKSQKLNCFILLISVLQKSKQNYPVIWRPFGGNFPIINLIAKSPAITNVLLACSLSGPQERIVCGRRLEALKNTDILIITPRKYFSCKAYALNPTSLNGQAGFYLQPLNISSPQNILHHFSEEFAASQPSEGHNGSVFQVDHLFPFYYLGNWGLNH